MGASRVSYRRRLLGAASGVEKTRPSKAPVKHDPLTAFLVEQYRDGKLTSQELATACSHAATSGVEGLQTAHLARAKSFCKRSSATCFPERALRLVGRGSTLAIRAAL